MIPLTRQQIKEVNLSTCPISPNRAFRYPPALWTGPLPEQNAASLSDKGGTSLTCGLRRTCGKNWRPLFLEPVCISDWLQMVETAVKR